MTDIALERVCGRDASMLGAIPKLIDKLQDPQIRTTDVIFWGCPVPSFGDLEVSKLATVGINPSNKEFVDDQGKELAGRRRRFPTLSSLGLPGWASIGTSHLKQIADYCANYFQRNPYDGWFKALDQIITDTGTSYYHPLTPACHLDLVPYATSMKWMDLKPSQRTTLLNLSRDTLGTLLRGSPVRVLVLNGQTVVSHLQDISDCQFEKKTMPSWELPRKSGRGVPGYSYVGVINNLAGVSIGHDVLVLGYNHNIQSSFGVTSSVRREIQHWVGQRVKGWL